ncbi:MAG: zinc-binding dehydrogenase [Caldilineaceae bacterium]|nr:zinc-binding dehydrogenase [Caldilineaceae bacterium]
MKGVAKLRAGVGEVGLLEAPEPNASPGHLVIEVTAGGLCGTDVHIFHDEYPSRPPVILGHEVAGKVVDVGEGVTRCRSGDSVTSEPYFRLCGVCAYCRAGMPNHCGQRASIGSGVHGAFARYVLVPERSVHLLPQGVDEWAGALTEPLACCVHALENTKVEPEDVVVVTGPGAIGLMMMQVVKAAGGQVVMIGTETDGARLELALTLGADEVLMVGSDDIQKAISTRSDGLGADVAFECSGAGAGAQTALELLRHRGRYVQVGLFGRPVTWDLEQVCVKEVQVQGTFATVSSSWQKALALLRSGLVRTGPLISHRLPLSDWQLAFELFERREGVKLVFTPA